MDWVLPIYEKPECENLMLLSLELCICGSFYKHGNTTPSSPKAQWSHTQSRKTTVLGHFSIKTYSHLCTEGGVGVGREKSRQSRNRTTCVPDLNLPFFAKPIIPIARFSTFHALPHFHGNRRRSKMHRTVYLSTIFPKKTRSIIYYKFI